MASWPPAATLPRGRSRAHPQSLAAARSHPRAALVKSMTQLVANRRVPPRCAAALCRRIQCRPALNMHRASATPKPPRAVSGTVGADQLGASARRPDCARRRRFRRRRLFRSGAQHAEEAHACPKHSLVLWGALHVLASAVDRLRASACVPVSFNASSVRTAMSQTEARLRPRSPRCAIASLRPPCLPCAFTSRSARFRTPALCGLSQRFIQLLERAA